MKIYGRLLEESLFFWDDFLVVGSDQVDEAAYQILVDHFGERAMSFKPENSETEYTREEWKKVFGWDELERVVRILATENS